MHTGPDMRDNRLPRRHDSVVERFERRFLVRPNAGGGGDPSDNLQDDNNPRLRSVVNRAKLGFLRTLAWTASDPASSAPGRRC